MRCFRGKELAPGFASEGRPSVGLFSEGVQHTNRVCRLVLLAFVGPCPEGQEACHDPDPNPMNCRLLNLRWDTRSENRLDRVRHETDPHRNRTHDKWGHLLAKPNLVAYHAALGRRGCLACARARGNRQTAVKNLRPFDFGTVADRHYRLIMNQRD